MEQTARMLRMGLVVPQSDSLRKTQRQEMATCGLGQVWFPRVRQGFEAEGAWGGPADLDPALALLPSGNPWEWADKNPAQLTGARTPARVRYPWPRPSRPDLVQVHEAGRETRSDSHHLDRSRRRATSVPRRLPRPSLEWDGASTGWAWLSWDHAS